jgi:hypothetical protein
MPTKIVPSPTSSLDGGVQATLRLVADPGLDEVSGRYFDQTRERRADPIRRPTIPRRGAGCASCPSSSPGREPAVRFTCTSGRAKMYM